MMTSRFKVLVITALFATGFIAACNNDDDGGGGIGCGAAFNWALEVEGELTELSNAAVAYGTDPTPANCERYKDAYRDYIDALRDVDNCIAGLAAADRKAYNDALDEAEEELEDFQC